MEIGLFGEYFIQLRKVCFEGFVMWEGVINECLEVLDEELGVHEDLGECVVGEEGEFELMVVFLGELIDGVFHFLEEEFEVFDFLDGVVLLFDEGII